MKTLSEQQWQRQVIRETKSAVLTTLFSEYKELTVDTGGSAPLTSHTAGHGLSSAHFPGACGAPGSTASTGQTTNKGKDECVPLGRKLPSETVEEGHSHHLVQFLPADK